MFFKASLSSDHPHFSLGEILYMTGLSIAHIRGIPKLFINAEHSRSQFSVENTLWVAAHTAVPIAVRLYDRLFKVAGPEGQDLADTLNDASVRTVQAQVEPAIVASDEPRFQFERVGYFYKDPEDSAPDSPVFNRIVTLRDSSGKRS